jgi:hypothetical protein
MPVVARLRSGKKLTYSTGVQVNAMGVSPGTPVLFAVFDNANPLPIGFIPADAIESIGTTDPTESK